MLEPSPRKTEAGYIGAAEGKNHSYEYKGNDGREEDGIGEAEGAEVGGYRGCEARGVSCSSESDSKSSRESALGG